ncbi:MAG: thioredoxin domain-containing protein [bacterium]
MNGSDQPQLTKKQRRELRKQEKQAERQRQTQSKKNRRFIIILFIIIIVVGGIYLITQLGDSTDTSVSYLNDNDPSKGLDAASVVIEEYSDFQCPACAAASNTVSQIVDDQPSDVRLIYNDFPISSHKNARPAAEAGQCAFAQGKFWDFHDRLFADQGVWNGLNSGEFVDVLKTYASDLSLDTEAFGSCLDNNEQSDAVNKDVSEANSRKVNSTPTFFVNGERYVGGRSYDDWMTVVEEAKAKAQATASETDITQDAATGEEATEQDSTVVEEVLTNESGE